MALVIDVPQKEYLSSKEDCSGTCSTLDYFETRRLGGKEPMRGIFAMALVGDEGFLGTRAGLRSLGFRVA